MSTAMEMVARTPRAIVLQKWNLQKLEQSEGEAWAECVAHGAENVEQLVEMVLAGDEQAMKLLSHLEAMTAYQEVARELMPLVSEPITKKGSQELTEFGDTLDNMLWPVKNQADLFGTVGRLAIKADEAMVNGSYYKGAVDPNLGWAFQEFAKSVGALHSAGYDFMSAAGYGSSD